MLLPRERERGRRREREGECAHMDRSVDMMQKPSEPNVGSVETTLQTGFSITDKHGSKGSRAQHGLNEH